MSFISLESLLFVFITIVVNTALPIRFRQAWLLVCSLAFISLLSLHSALVIAGLSTINFALGKHVTYSKNAFYFGIILNLSAIISTNYFSYSAQNLSLNIKSVGFSLSDFIIVIGLSFYSIQHIAYLIDIRKKKIMAESVFLNFLFYSSYFPKFLSGPITKYQEIQVFTREIAPKKADLISGFNRFLLGLFKKIVLADGLAPSIHSVFDFDNKYPGLTLFTAGFLFTIQLYFDFSGYTDMAIGVSKMLGITLPENFNLSLRSKSIGEFWRRWHISLIRFFTEYIFYPISYKYRKLKKASAVIGIIVTFIVSGLWHGIGLTFFIWSLCHLCYLCLELLFSKPSNSASFIRKAFGWLYVIIAVSFSNVFFRIKSVDLLEIKSKALFSINNFIPSDFSIEFFAPLAVGWHQIEQFNFGIIILFSFLFLLVEKKLNQLAIKTSYSILYTYIFIMLILMFGVFNNGEQFIYMQF